MEHILAAMMLGGLAIGQMLIGGVMSGQFAGQQSAIISDGAPRDPSALPAAPGGKSTILGGEIRSVDLVRDQFMLKILGQRPVKILFDERTQVYIDGKRIPLRELHSHDHASVQTVLDGTNVFALSIHMLSQSPEGEYQGHILNYNPDTSELTVGAALTRQPIRLLVPKNTPVVRQNPAAFSPEHPGLSELVKGALVSITFESDIHGRGVAHQITIIAAPGSAFVFSGNLTSLDLHSGFFVLVDPRDNKSYQVYFDSTRLPGSQNLHEGDNVRATAIFDGDRYVASTIDLN